MLRDRPHERTLYGVLAEFLTPDELVRATEMAYREGYRKMDAYSPMPIHGLAEAMGVWRTTVPRKVLIGGLTGAAFGYGLQYFMAAIAYVFNVGGRPVHSWPSFIPVTFETTVLFASLTAVLGMIIMNGLPQPYHPIFNAERFALATRDRFFLCIEAPDPKFDSVKTPEFLRSLEPFSIEEVYD